MGIAALKGIRPSVAFTVIQRQLPFITFSHPITLLIYSTSAARPPGALDATALLQSICHTRPANQQRVRVINIIILFHLTDES